MSLSCAHPQPNDCDCEVKDTKQQGLCQSHGCRRSHSPGASELTGSKTLVLPVAIKVPWLKLVNCPVCLKLGDFQNQCFSVTEGESFLSKSSWLVPYCYQMTQKATLSHRALWPGNQSHWGLGFVALLGATPPSALRKPPASIMGQHGVYLIEKEGEPQAQP